MPSKRKLSYVDFATVEGTQPKKPRVQLTTSIAPKEIAVVRTRVSGIQGLEKVELEETKKRLGQVKQESAELLSRIQQSLECGICKDTIQNPYTLECGHSACYTCLRGWWVTPEGSVSTDADPDVEQSQPRVHLKSDLHRQKLCHECRKVLTTRPVPDRRLRDVVDAIRAPPLSVAELMKRDERWGRSQDVWEGIFPLHDDSSIRNTQQSYILPPITQGQIETPPPSSSLYPLHPIHPFHHSRHDSEVGQRRAERRSQPYNVLERRRGEQYDPVREARREMEELREHQRRSRALSPSSSPAASAPLTPPPPLSRPPAAELASYPGPSLFVAVDQSSAITDVTRLPETETRSSQPHAYSFLPRTQTPLPSSPTHPPPRLQFQLPSLIELLSLPRPSYQFQLPSLAELLSRPLPSDVTLSPIVINNPSPASIEVLETLHDDEVREGDEPDSEPAISTSLLSDLGADTWITADLED